MFYFQVPFLQVLKDELRFVFKCKGSVKPVKKKAEEGENNEIYGGSNEYNYGLKNPPTWFSVVTSRERDDVMAFSVMTSREHDVTAAILPPVTRTEPSYEPSSIPNADLQNNTPTHSILGATALIRGHPPCSECCSSIEQSQFSVGQSQFSVGIHNDSSTDFYPRRRTNTPQYLWKTFAGFSLKGRKNCW